MSAQALFASGLTSLFLTKQDPISSYHEGLSIVGHSNPLPLKYLDKKNDAWQNPAPKKKINSADLLSHYSYGVQYSSTLSFGYFGRSEKSAIASADFIEAYGQFDTNTYLLADKNRNYKIKGEIAGYRAKGIYVQKSFPYKAHQLIFNFRYLYGAEYEDARIAGEMLDDSKELHFRLLIDNHYSYKSDITGRENRRIDFHGHGGALDLSYKVDGDNYMLEMGIQNIVGFIRWESVPYYVAVVDSNRTYVKSNGYLGLNPIVQGRYLIKESLRTELTPHAYFYAEYDLNVWQFYYMGYRYFSENHYLFTLSRAYKKAHFELSYLVDNGFILSYEHPYFWLSLSQNALAKEDETFVVMSAGYRYNF